jgi:hypothetical protein
MRAGSYGNVTLCAIAATRIPAAGATKMQMRSDADDEWGMKSGSISIPLKKNILDDRCG